MCGIAGYINFDKEKGAEQGIVKRMTDVIAHRGPDGEGYYINGNIALGHRRLSIIDLNTGAQPMFSEDKRFVIIHNGEIYNYIELREELIELGFRFSTVSDTEVIIKSFEAWGVNCMNKFNGMWAFALWDDKEKTLFISRDRIGEKPLHYSIYNNTFIFGSEIKCILAYGCPKEINYDVSEIYLTLGYVPAPFTFYKNISKLKPGYYLNIKGNEVREHCYWDLPEVDEKSFNTDKKEIYERFEYLLDDSVKIRMRSDVPYGAFLSGGLDSSSVVSLMSNISNHPIKTFTIGFNDKAFDERVLAKEVADKFKCEHNEHLVSQESFDESLNRILNHYDEPFGDSSAIPTGYVSKYAAEKVKMVLTGDGGDEVLSGYTSYQGEKFVSQFKDTPRLVKKSALGVNNILKKSFGGSVRYKFNRVSNILDSLDMDFNKRIIQKSAWIDLLTIKEITKKIKCIRIEDFISDFMNKCFLKDGFYGNMFYNLKLSLPDDMLTKVDRMSMAYSLETRVPFLDFRIIEFMYSVDKKIKMRGYKRKSILRNTIAKNLPENLLKARKKGFGVPVREWFKNKQLKQTLDKLFKKDDIFNSKVINGVIENNYRGISDNGNFIWMLLVLKTWMSNNT
jgi:asparagine synthase (glutamine-hydrolysing)